MLKLLLQCVAFPDVGVVEVLGFYRLLPLCRLRVQFKMVILAWTGSATASFSTMVAALLGLLLPLLLSIAVDVVTRSSVTTSLICLDFCCLLVCVSKLVEAFIHMYTHAAPFCSLSSHSSLPKLNAWCSWIVSRCIYTGATFQLTCHGKYS